MRSLLPDQKLFQFFCFICIWWHCYRNSFELKKVSNGFKIYWNTSLKLLYLKGYKWLLPQNQRVRNAFLVKDGTRHWLSRLTFLKNIKVKGCQCTDYIRKFNFVFWDQWHTSISLSLYSTAWDIHHNRIHWKFWLEKVYQILSYFWKEFLF